MSYQFSVENKGAYLLIRIRGQFSLENEYEADRYIVGQCNEYKIFRALVDDRLIKGHATEADAFASASTLRDRGLDELEKVAFVDVPEHLNVIRFYETVATNRGIKVGTFSEIEEAEVWLQS